MMWYSVRCWDFKKICFEREREEEFIATSSIFLKVRVKKITQFFFNAIKKGLGQVSKKVNRVETLSVGGRGG